MLLRQCSAEGYSYLVWRTFYSVTPTLYCKFTPFGVGNLLVIPIFVLQTTETSDDDQFAAEAGDRRTCPDREYYYSAQGEYGAVSVRPHAPVFYYSLQPSSMQVDH